MRGRTRKRKGRPALKQIDLFIVSFFLVGRQGVLPGVASAGGGSEDEKEEEKSIIEYNTITLLKIPMQRWPQPEIRKPFRSSFSLITL